MRWSDFEDEVCSQVEDEHFQSYKHNLSLVIERYRERYIITLKCGFDMPNAYYHLCKGQKLPDFNYFRYLKYISKQ